MTPDTTSAGFDLLKQIAAHLSCGEVTFPTFAAATLKIRTALADPEISTQRLCEAIRSEPVVGLRLVKLANSAANRGAGKAVSDIASAVARVGINAVRAVAMAVVMDQLRATRELRAFHSLADSVWTHSMQVAANAWVLAAHVPRLNPEEALFAGVVHDVGYYYLMSRFHNHEAVGDDPERARLLFSQWHAPIGAAVLHEFDLPEALTDAIGQHEELGYNVPFRTYRDVLAAANHLAFATNPALHGEPSPAPAAQELREFMAKHDEEVQAVAAALR
jgi:putative nucleotidyltransferase with HDIG domain